ncbi:unnamed protein product [Pseudo-nitzschia multistriata]|uniref:Uncharacterized protein n=1 Tax=Pseudo-nitzschia multistriata TaxID=183589 RepID=A0A448YYH7_9STRA|nr:unnamed protein product [Pseudo-nitzschia multistriata]
MVSDSQFYRSITFSATTTPSLSIKHQRQKFCNNQKSKTINSNLHKRIYHSGIMYGGLFGDLPSTKKDAAKNDKDKVSDKDNNSKGEGSNDNDAKNQSAALSKKRGNNFLFAPRKQPLQKKSGTNTTEKGSSKSSSNPSSNFLQTVGKSGTSMAFVPAAAMKAKRKKAPAPAPQKTSNNASSQSCSHLPSIGTETITTTTITTTKRKSIHSTDEDDPSRPPVVVDIHGTGTTSDQSSSAKNTGQTSASISESSFVAKNDRILDPYDPFVPNDLLDYWETLAAKKQREFLERETREALERQQELREHLEQERSELLGGDRGERMPGRGRGRGISNLPSWLVDRQGSNDGKQQPEEGLGGNPARHMGRGRGRGISNLPAWLVEQQRREAAEGPQ